MPVLAQAKIGDCECCDSTNVKITLRHGNMWMCDDCWVKEPKLNVMIETSRTIDSNIQFKADIYNAATIAAKELQAAIQQDEAIPEDQKGYRYTEECFMRMKHLQEVIFKKKQELAEDENTARMWQVEVQTSAPKLRADLRAKYANLNIDYTPKSPKVSKPAATPSPSKIKTAEVHAACVKAGIVNLEPTVAMFLKMRPGMSIDAAVAEVIKTVVKS